MRRLLRHPLTLPPLLLVTAASEGALGDRTLRRPCDEKRTSAKATFRKITINPVANGGPTSYKNLQVLCWDHHQEKTEEDRAAGLLAGGGLSR